MTEIIKSMKDMGQTLYDWFYNRFIHDKFQDKGNMTFSYRYQNRMLVYKMKEYEHNISLCRLTNETVITVFTRIEGDCESDYKKDLIRVNSTHSSKRNRIHNSLWYKGCYYKPNEKFKDGFKIIPEFLVVHKLNKGERINEYFATLEYQDLDTNQNIQTIANSLYKIIQNNTVKV